jgi:hypothetical protein
LVGITDTNGNTNTIYGMVERTGVLWVQGLPLAEGTNWVTLAVTNAAGLGSVTNFCLSRSSMVLALTSIDGDLWNPTVNASGNVSDTTAAIYVNGVPGTNHGDGTGAGTESIFALSATVKKEVSSKGQFVDGEWKPPGTIIDGDWVSPQKIMINGKLQGADGIVWATHPNGANFCFGLSPTERGLQ